MRQVGPPRPNAVLVRTLRRQMAAHDLRRFTVAEAAGISLRELDRILSGAVLPHDGTLANLLAAVRLGVEQATELRAQVANIRARRAAAARRAAEIARRAAEIARTREQIGETVAERIILARDARYFAKRFGRRRIRRLVAAISTEGNWFVRYEQLPLVFDFLTDDLTALCGGFLVVGNALHIQTFEDRTRPSATESDTGEEADAVENRDAAMGHRLPEPELSPDTLGRRARRLIAKPERPERNPLDHCVYCGAYTVGRVCPAHEPLVGLDPLAAAR